MQIPMKLNQVTVYEWALYYLCLYTYVYAYIYQTGPPLVIGLNIGIFFLLP